MTTEKEADALKPNEELIEELNNFASNMRKQTHKLKEDFSGEEILLRDENAGFTFSAKSLKFDALQLSNLALDSFRIMRQEKLNPKPVGVG
jgi:hypothetical protein